MLESQHPLEGTTAVFVCVYMYVCVCMFGVVCVRVCEHVHTFVCVFMFRLVFVHETCVESLFPSFCVAPFPLDFQLSD